MSNHKYVTGGSGYYTRTFCEWCGYIVHYSNDSGVERKKRERENRKHTECPNSPIPVTHTKKEDS